MSADHSVNSTPPRDRPSRDYDGRHRLFSRRPVADRCGVEDGDLLYVSGERCTSHIESVVVQRNRSTPRVHGPGTNHLPRLLPTVSASILDLLRLIWYPSPRIKESP